MIPPPKPDTNGEIVDWVVVNVPRDASMLLLVGSGPRWNGLSAAVADGADNPPPPTSASESASPANARLVTDRGSFILG